MSRRTARGDFQTPPALALAVTQHLRRLGIAPRTVVEPTCGTGAFLGAAAAVFPAARRLGWELEPTYAAEARAHGASVTVADVFGIDWEIEARAWQPPVLILGNPPWVTTATLGRIGSDAAPVRRNPGLQGLDAITGTATFDVSEWVLRRLRRAAPDAVIAVLCKTAVARRLLVDGERLAGIWSIDAARWFGASVDAALVVLDPNADAGRCPVHQGLDAPAERVLTVDDGALIEDAELWARHGHLLGRGPTWRSGVKHDAAAILELVPGPDGLRNGLGEPVQLEDEAHWPLAKGGDLHRGSAPSRRVLLPQQALSDDPAALATCAPRAFAYLQRHRERLDARRSRVWRTAPPLGIFGVGPYTFAPYKVAVAALYPSPRFRLLTPVDGRPVVLDDTGYFLPFDEESDARDALRRLESEAAAGFLRARIPPGAKRPITARLLRSLALDRLP